MFGTSGLRDPVGETVTAGLALDIWRALASDGVDTVIIGRDACDSSRMLSRAHRRITEYRADVIDLGFK